MALTTLDIKEPGLNVLPPGVERHTVCAGGLTGLQIFPDDQLEVLNDEGNQICEIICLIKTVNPSLEFLVKKKIAKKTLLKKY